MNTELKENKIVINYEGKNHELCEYMFGVLKANHDSPLCCVSEANNSFSIDYFKGCSFQCAYCHVQGIYEDLDSEYRMYNRAIPRSKYSIEEIIDALVIHPYFVKDKSVISIGTSSTEPFASETVIDNTLSIMEYFCKLGYKNPFWIVTKAGIPSGIENRLKGIIDNGNRVMISICWANNPSIIEPVQNNRFRNIELKEKIGFTTSWYLRPLVEEWGANRKNLKKMIQHISNNYGKYIDMIIAGGLRWTDGIEFGLKDIRKLQMPKLIKEYNKKTLSNELEKCIIELCNEYFKNVPVYFNSSCGISHMLNRSNIALLNIFNEEICNKSLCGNKCSNRCHNISFSEKDLRIIEDNLNNQGINIKIEDISFKNKIKTTPEFETYSYTEKQQIKKTIALIYSERCDYDEKQKTKKR